MVIKELIKNIEEYNKSKVICYITNDNRNFSAQINSDIYLYFQEMLLNMGQQDRIDLFLFSMGGNTLVPWKLVNMIKQYTKKFTVLIPYHANSAATLISLGADRIIMGRMGDISPIDPTITTPFNPPIQGQEADLRARIGVSVEDVMSYYELAKSTMNLKEEASLLKAFELLSQSVNPLALGAVHRSYNQIRILAQKLLKLHLNETDDYLLINRIIENLTQKLYNHGHLINRNEALEILSDKIIEIPDDNLEDLMWKLFDEYRKHMHISEHLDLNLKCKNFKPYYSQAELNSDKIDVEGIIAAIQSSDIRYEYKKIITLEPALDLIQTQQGNIYKNIGIKRNNFDKGWVKI
jgi:hypothetical protein